jgi:GNAT superfamily N-acetyltransferase
MLQIQPAREADVAQILRFIRELARYERLEHEVIATEADLRAALFGERPFAEALLARLDGAPAGFALFFHNFSTFTGRPGLYLEDLYVTPPARGRGIGRQLLRHLATVAIERRCARVDWAVLDWNTSAIAFYRSLGAQPLEDWRVFRLTGAPLEQLAGRDGG